MNTREYRYFDIRLRESEPDEESYIVEGYATTFDDPYVLFRDGDTDYLEAVSADAFKDCDMSDVVFRVDHEGKVYARTKNGAVELKADDHGLLTRTNLGMTKAGRELYEEIKAGEYYQMSMAFTVGAMEYDMDQNLRTITRIDKLYDISPVTFPANPNTDISIISARDAFHGEMERIRAERLRAERNIRILTMKCRLLEASK